MFPDCTVRGVYVAGTHAVCSDDIDLFISFTVIQLHRPISSEPYLTIQRFSFADTPVSVPAGLYLAGKSSGGVEIWSLACW